MDSHVVAQPMNELAVRNSKYAGECVELHLGKRNISMLADRDRPSSDNDFTRFINLEVLWCNNNRLVKLDGLDANFRIKTLFCHDNRVSTLRDSSIQFMTFLSVLSLANNRLTDFKLTLSVLRRQNHLHDLDLSGNPISEEKDYRLHVIKQIPWLEVLDKHRVTDEERKKALKLKPLDTQIDIMAAATGGGGGGGGKTTQQIATKEGGGGATAAVAATNQHATAAAAAGGEGTMAAATAFGGGGGDGGGEVNSSGGAKANSSTGLKAAATAAVAGGGGAGGEGEALFHKTVTTRQSMSTFIHSVQDLASVHGEAWANTLKALKLKVKEKRICLKPHFMERDPRGEEVLRDDVVIDVLHMYHLWPTSTAFHSESKLSLVNAASSSAAGAEAAAKTTATASAGASGGGGDGSSGGGSSSAFLGAKAEGFIPGSGEDVPFTVEQENILARFAVPAPMRSKELGRDPSVLKEHVWSRERGTTPRRFIDYVSLCSVLEPVSNKRDQDEQERRLEQDWNKPLASRTKIQRLLEAEVKAYRKEMKEEEERQRQAMVGGSTSTSTSNPDGGGQGGGSGGDASHLSNTKATAVSTSGGGKGFSFGSGFDHHLDLGACQLSAWEVHAFSRFLISVQEKQRAVARALQIQEKLLEWTAQQEEEEGGGEEGENGNGDRAQGGEEDGDSGGEPSSSSSGRKPPAFESFSDDDLGLPPMSGELTRAELIKCLEQMTLLGRTFSLPEVSLDDNDLGGSPLSGAMSPRSPTNSMLSRKQSICAGSGGGPSQEYDKKLFYDRIFRALDLSLSAAAARQDGVDASSSSGGGCGGARKKPAGGGGGKEDGGKGGDSTIASSPSSSAVVTAVDDMCYPWKAFFKAILHGLKDEDTSMELLPPMQWAALGSRGCLEKAADLFAEATLIQRRVLTGHENPSDIATLAELSTHGTRLRKIAAQNPRSGEEDDEDDDEGAGYDDNNPATDNNNNQKLQQQQQQLNQSGTHENKFSTMKGAATHVIAQSKFKNALKNKKQTNGGGGDKEPSTASNGGGGFGRSGSLGGAGGDGGEFFSEEVKKARKLEMLRRKFRLSKEDAEAMLANNTVH